MDDLLALGALGLLEIVTIQTGRLVVRLVSLGRWKAEPISSDQSRIHAPAGALSFRHDGRRVVTPNGSLFVGIAFYVVLVASLLALVTGGPRLQRLGFDTAAWKAAAGTVAATNDRGCVRGGMAVDLVEKRNLIGATGTEVVSLLGSPQDASGQWSYDVGQCGTWWGQNALVLTFDANGRVRSVELE